MKLIEYLPNDYTKSSATLEVLEAMEKMWQKAQAGVADFEDQLFLSKATWGLELWEKIYGIETDPSKSYDIRRSVVRAKIRGAGTTTVAMIKNTSEAYVNGEVEVIEQPSLYKFIILMVSIIGRPPNVDDLRRTIDEIKPAHLEYEIIFKYNAHGDVGRYTHGQLKESGYTHEELRTVKLPEISGIERRR